MIVEDDTNFGMVLKDYLALHDYDVFLYRDGQQAIEKFEPGKFNLCILDVMMPVMDGATFREVQRQQPRLARIPVVVMSAAENIEAQAPTLTADAYLPKPIDFDALLAVAEQYGGQQRQAGE